MAINVLLHGFGCLIQDELYGSSGKEATNNPEPTSGGGDRKNVLENSRKLFIIFVFWLFTIAINVWDTRVNYYRNGNLLRIQADGKNR
jgi:hypothetical protein